MIDHGPVLSNKKLLVIAKSSPPVIINDYHASQETTDPNNSANQENLSPQDLNQSTSTNDPAPPELKYFSDPSFLNQKNLDSQNLNQSTAANPRITPGYPGSNDLQDIHGNLSSITSTLRNFKGNDQDGNRSSAPSESIYSSAPQKSNESTATGYPGGYYQDMQGNQGNLNSNLSSTPGYPKGYDQDASIKYSNVSSFVNQVNLDPQNVNKSTDHSRDYNHSNAPSKLKKSSASSPEANIIPQQTPNQKKELFSVPPGQFLPDNKPSARRDRNRSPNSKVQKHSKKSTLNESSTVSAQKRIPPVNSPLENETNFDAPSNKTNFDALRNQTNFDASLRNQTSFDTSPRNQPNFDDAPRNQPNFDVNRNRTKFDASPRNQTNFNVPRNHTNFDAPRNQPNFGAPLINQTNFDASPRNQTNFDIPINQTNFGVPLRNQNNFGAPPGNQTNFDAPSRNQTNFGAPLRNQNNFGAPPGNQTDFKPFPENQTNFNFPPGSQTNFGFPPGAFPEDQNNFNNFDAFPENQNNFDSFSGNQFNFDAPTHNFLNVDTSTESQFENSFVHTDQTDQPMELPDLSQLMNDNTFSNNKSGKFVPNFQGDSPNFFMNEDMSTPEKFSSSSFGGPSQSTYSDQESDVSDDFESSPKKNQSRQHQQILSVITKHKYYHAATSAFESRNKPSLRPGIYLLVMNPEVILPEILKKNLVKKEHKNIPLSPMVVESTNKQAFITREIIKSAVTMDRFYFTVQISSLYDELRKKLKDKALRISHGINMENLKILVINGLNMEDELLGPMNSAIEAAKKESHLKKEREVNALKNDGELIKAKAYKLLRYLYGMFESQFLSNSSDQSDSSDEGDEKSLNLEQFDKNYPGMSKKLFQTENQRTFERFVYDAFIEAIESPENNCFTIYSTFSERIEKGSSSYFFSYFNLNKIKSLFTNTNVNKMYEQAINIAKNTQDQKLIHDLLNDNFFGKYDDIKKRLVSLFYVEYSKWRNDTFPGKIKEIIPKFSDRIKEITSKFEEEFNLEKGRILEKEHERIINQIESMYTTGRIFRINNIICEKSTENAENTENDDFDLSSDEENEKEVLRAYVYFCSNFGQEASKIIELPPEFQNLECLQFSFMNKHQMHLISLDFEKRLFYSSIVKITLEKTQYRFQQRKKKNPLGRVKLALAKNNYSLIKGSNTHFKRDIKVNENIVLMGERYCILEVISDTELKIVGTFRPIESTWIDFQIEPKTKLNGFIETYRLMYEKYPIDGCVDGGQVRPLNLRVVLDISDEDEIEKYQENFEEYITEMFVELRRTTKKPATMLKKFKTYMSLMFQRFQDGALLLNDPKLFQAKLCIIIKDVPSQDKDDIVREFTLRFNSLVAQEAEDNFITKMYPSGLVILPWALFSDAAYKNLKDVKRMLDKQDARYENARTFLQNIKVIMAKLKICDWGSLDENLVQIRVANLRRFIPTAISLGIEQKDPTKELLTNYDTGLEIENPTVLISAIIEDYDQSTELLYDSDLLLYDEESNFLDLSKDLRLYFEEKIQPRVDSTNDSEWFANFEKFIKYITERRVYRVQEWFSQNVSKFPQDNSDIVIGRYSLEQEIGGDYKCPNQCIIPCEDEHDAHHCENDSACPIQCPIPDCPRRCESNDHFHAFSELLVNHFYCEEPGVCKVLVEPKKQEDAYQGLVSTFTFIRHTQVSERLKCKIKIPPNSFEHAGKHSHDENTSVHCCDVQCTLPYGHTQPLHETSHGNMIQTVFTSNDDKEFEYGGHKLKSGDQGTFVMCNLHCKDAGRHRHIDYCKNGNNCKNTKNLQHIQGKINPDPDQPKDYISHRLFWERTGFKEPYSAQEQAEFTKCDHECNDKKHRDPDSSGVPPSKSYCQLEIFHDPVDSSAPPPGNYGYVSLDGHHFNCDNPVTREATFHIVLVLDRSSSMSYSDKKPIKGANLPDPVYQNLVQKHNNRTGAVYSAVYSFLETRISTVKNNTPSNVAAPPKDIVSLILFDSSSEIIVENQKLDNSNYFMQEMLKHGPRGGTNFDMAIQKAGVVIDRHFDPLKTNIIIFCSDGECGVPENQLKQICSRNKQKGSPLYLYTILFGTDACSTSLERMKDIAKSYHPAASSGSLKCQFSKIMTEVNLVNHLTGVAESLRRHKPALLKKNV
ncbi:7782_t:CDS:10 [Diversispora eburnea]|uniref:7782_t:CDS:1 n=1 Tax=Diversispora eburnea TaxID=1213867 RepID=A0A9N8UWW7_9GLOM|nr:7782_t:CDS:10 [Diversispora eburnea]